ncbi:hypothetical protein FD754_006668 [Muntiacus muntjak]|uniref:C2H2-type domain-containing protein n=1 Tax=Muntiacus muntjak TaxID=9888 RepID=A0A5N3WL16_MUNMU|nr:hypothetical protein FD754_006668 [Muntiacus muntjak]
MFISTCFKSHCSRRVEENTCSDSSFCTFESVPGSKSPSYTWSKLCDLLTYEMECLVQAKLEKGKHSNSLILSILPKDMLNLWYQKLSIDKEVSTNLVLSSINALPCHKISLQNVSKQGKSKWKCGFHPIPEQCQIKFKSLQKSYRKVRNAHMLEPCAFFENMGALLNPAAHVSSTDKPREILSLPRLKRTGISAKEQINLVEGEDAAEESDGDEMGVDGVHWGYEETKTFLDILHETRFYEVLQAYHRKSKLYGACWTKFKSLQKSYHKVKNGQVLDSPKEALSPSVQERDNMEIEPQEPTGWDPEEDSQEALVEDSGSERMSLLQNPSDFEIGSSNKEDATQMICKDMEQHRAFIEKAKRIVSQNVDPGKYHKRACISGRQWESLHGIGQGKLMPQSRDLGKAVVHQRPLVGKRLFRLLSVEESFGRSVRLMCRMTHQKENPSKCSVCGKCFGRSRSLVQHQRIHMGENPFKEFTQERSPTESGECGKCFSQSSSLVMHQRTHTGEKPYQCGDAHRRVHSGKNPYKCVGCEKSSNNCTRFHEHQGVHTGEKPSGHIQCGRHFSKSSVLIKHREGHVRGKLLPCQHSAPRRTP